MKNNLLNTKINNLYKPIYLNDIRLKKINFN